MYTLMGISYGGTMGRNIIHAEATAFPIQIERLQNSKLRSYPLIIAPPNERAVIYALSEEVRQAGIRPGMLLSSALKLCRDAIVLPPNEPLYLRASAAMNRILGELTPVIEPVRQGRTFLDVTGTQRLFGSAIDIGSRALNEIKSRLRISLKVGVANNKLVSKIASYTTSDNGLEYVKQGDEAQFIAPFHVHLLPQVTRKVQEQMLALNIKLIGELACVSLSHLAMLFGRLGIQFHNYAQGIDWRPVFPPAQSPSIVEIKIFNEDTNDVEVLQTIVFLLVEKAIKQLREKSLIAKKLCLFIRYSDYKEDKTQSQLPEIADYETKLFSVANELLRRGLRRRVRVRQLAIKLWDLKPKSTQLSLFETKQSSKADRVMRTMEKIRQRFGYDSIQYARTLMVG